MNPVVVSKSGDNISGDGAVDRFPTAEEIAQLIALSRMPPRVYDYEIAEELGCHASSLSRFLRGRDALPYGMGPESFRSAVERIRARKRGAAA